MVDRKLRVAVDCRVTDRYQGLGSSLLALAQGLSRLQDPDQEYLFLVPEALADWLKPFLGPACSLVSLPAAPVTLATRLRAQLKKMPFLRMLWLRVRQKGALVPVSDGLLERLHCDVVHFPSQVAYLTKVPSLYQPWDLQHRHLPQFFSEADLLLRNTLYPAFCHQAHVVSVQTEWGKQDLVQQFGIAPDKVVVVRCGVPVEEGTVVSASEEDQIARALQLPDVFLFYPAVTWPHKNHELLLRGLALIKQRSGEPMHIVLTGKATAERSRLERMADQLGVLDYLHFLGFVSPQHMQVIRRRAFAMIFPSRFEGLGLPLLEAFQAGLPVLCSSATVLPEVAGDAALLFDPDSPEQMVAAIEQLRASPALRARLTEAGSRIFASYSLDVAARQFAALYRRIAEEHAAIKGIRP